MTNPRDTELLPLADHHVVICVDDEPPTLSALRRLLGGEPYELRTTTSPRQVLDWLDDAPVSLVLSDHRMPEMTGVEMLAAVRERSPGTTGVMLTAYGDFARQHPRTREVVREMIEKPWNDRSLKRTVRHLLRERELRKRRA